MQTFATHTGEMQASKLQQAGSAASSENSLPVCPYHLLCGFSSFPQASSLDTKDLLPHQGLYVP